MEEPNEKDKKEDEPEGETLDFTHPAYEFIPKGYHGWRQQGYYLICKTCDLEHAVFIGSEKIMVGENDRGPILKDRKDFEGR